MESFLKRLAPRARSDVPSQFRLEVSVTPGNAHEYDLWRSGISPLFVLDAPDAETRSSFGVQMTSYQFADVAIGAGRSSAANLKRSASMTALNGIDNISLVVYAEGGCALDVEGRPSEVHVGDICFLDLSRPCAIRAPKYESLTLLLPRAMLQPLVADLDGLHGKILQTSNPLNALLASHLRTLFAKAPALGSADGRAAANGTAALVAAFAGASDNGRDAIVRNESARSLHAFRRLIERNVQNFELGPEFLCRQLGVSRATLYRAFEPMGGVSNYILQRRLTNAYRLIADQALANQRIGAIASRCGFSNISVFSRAFSQAYGIPPSELRNALKQADNSGIESSGESGFGTMSRWLLGLNAVEG
jgi:AraC-like DNA-binding protein